MLGDFRLPPRNCLWSRWRYILLLHLAAMLRFPQAGFLPLAAPPAVPARTSRWRLDERSRCFEGHFDGDPILPGVAHLALALRALAEETAAPRILTGVKDVRFKCPLGPGDEVEVVLADRIEASSVRFEIRRHGELVSVGLLLFTSGESSRG
jgi:hypothetical protein